MKNLLALVFLLPIFAVGANDYEIDKGHTNINFEVDHLAFSTVTGRFDVFNGSVTLDPKTLALVKVNGNVETKSINTNNEKRDKHLRSEDFFFADKFPTLTFESEEMNLSPGKKGTMKGKLTLRGITQAVKFDVNYKGAGKDPWGNEKAAFSATTTINRKDFGLKWNQALETGGVLVGEDVKISLNIEADKVTKPAIAATEKATPKK